MDNFTIYSIAIVPMITGLVQLLKLYIPAKYAPLAALVLGLVVGIANGIQTGWPIFQSIVVGISLGLSAGGLYSGVKKTLE